MRKLLMGAFLLTVVAATPAFAQGDRPVHFNIGGGFTVPVGDVADRFSTGGNFTLGVIFEPTPAFGLQVEYAYNGLSGQDKTISVSATPTAVSIDRILGDRSSWDPGINVGGGLTLKLGESALFYVETRWHYTWGPEFTDLQGNTQKANSQYFPVTFGFRF
jgi:hypothetical protein